MEKGGSWRTKIWKKRSKDKDKCDEEKREETKK